MKKNLLGWFAMATMLVGTGCSSDEVVNDYSPENAIQFGTYVGRDAVSRGSIITTEGNTNASAGIVSPSLREKGFGVFAYYTDNGSFTDNVYDNNGCNWTSKSYNYVDDLGVQHTVQTRTCLDCGFTRVKDYYYVTEGCYVYEYSDYIYSIGGEEIISAHSYSNYTTQHVLSATSLRQQWMFFSLYLV